MTPNEARAAIISRINTLGLPTDMGALNMVEDTSTVTPDDTVWIRPSITFDGGGQESLGGADVATRRVRSGTIIVQIFSQLGAGMVPGDTAANNILLAFEARSDGPIRYTNCGLRDVGRDEPWWQVNFTAAFEYDVVCV